MMGKFGLVRARKEQLSERQRERERVLRERLHFQELVPRMSDLELADALTVYWSRENNAEKDAEDLRRRLIRRLAEYKLAKQRRMYIEEERKNRIELRAECAVMALLGNSFKLLPANVESILNVETSEPKSLPESFDGFKL